MSTRRSSRARPTNLPPRTQNASNTISSLASSTRPERTMRATGNKQSSPQKDSSRSLSSEELHAPPLTRRRTREQEPDEPDSPNVDDTLIDEEDEQEVTRCVCTFLEYPGPPSVGGRSKDGPLADAAAQSDESAWFIQCDICKCHVWQHGQCVGIPNEASSPDNYFCEECRRDLHKVMTDSKGQKYSRYLPFYESVHGKTRRASPKDADTRSGREKERNARPNADSLGKRRSTMNSRAAYDEDEVLRKVLEESKHEGGPAVQSENGSRRKRSRDDSEEVKPEVKRQRTGSRSASNSPAVETDDESHKHTTTKQKPRGAAARSKREKELREKERERERQEAANRRKGRAERRKQEEPEAIEAAPSEDMPPPAPTPSASAPPETPIADLKPAPAPRKTGRPGQKRQGRLGRNQYSKDGQSTTTNGASPPTNGDCPNSPQTGGTNGVNNDSSDGTSGQKPTKKNRRFDKLSWNDIKRPAGAMQSFIAQREVELAVEKSLPLPAVQLPSKNSAEQSPGEPDELEEFRKLSTLEMMDNLSRELAHWQQMVANVTA
ncbi:uncharacterized protein EI97DRAFT_393055 [Westerdykella ornata]|uniref:Zinc finger PHD-type domain-containing protein n=1 Tax=Westerdykella ornata TaxID=318751 RepID=A0A6A6JVQ3_WESOR|nr:uncharacterized protein EI97DRAFT_393055 [Westerdykella ornata]KAF2279826.1 hypothetical protein EI97DRAFT_393055 [Westerdykella ornata]